MFRGNQVFFTFAALERKQVFNFQGLFTVVAYEILVHFTILVFNSVNSALGLLGKGVI